MNNLFNLSEEEKNRIRGLHLTESKDNRITSVLSEQGLIMPCGEERLSITMLFGPGEDTSNWKTWVIEPYKFKRNIEWIRELKCLLNNGMAGDRPFIDIRGGTSATGNFRENEKVMHNRIDTAFTELETALQIFRIKGRNDLPYSEEALREKSRIDHRFDVIEPGSKIPGTREQVPTDPNDPWFNDKQYVTITLNPATDTPEYVNLAYRFIEAVEGVGTDDTEIYEILDELRDKEDINNFNDYLTRLAKKQNFYEIACERAKIPGAEGKTSIFGLFDVDLVPDEVGPPELGTKDRTLNNLLKNKLIVRPISDFC